MRYDISQHNAERVIHLPNAEIAARYIAGETIAELALAYSVSRPTIAKALKAENVKCRPASQRAGVLAGSSNPSWNGGRRIRRDGYVVLWTPSGEKLEHRVVMERVLGRELDDTEVVHHKDENRQNNSPKNLQIMTRAEHILEHIDDMHEAKRKKFRVHRCNVDEVRL